MRNKFERPEYIEDCKLIKAKAFEWGFDLSLLECEEIWCEISGKSCAGWLCVDDKSLESRLRDYFDMEEEDE